MTNKAGASKVLKVKDIFGRNCCITERTMFEQARKHICRALDAGERLSSIRTAKRYLRLLLGKETREVFYAVWLNNQNEVLKHGVLFRGTIDRATIYPREIVKEALRCNAAAVIFGHNHPSGDSTPSSEDIDMTLRLKLALSLIDVTVLDHIVVGRNTVSISDMGFLKGGALFPKK